MFILLHSINLVIILLAAWIYLHPFDAVRPSMQWIYVAHAIAFISLVLVVASGITVAKEMDWIPGILGNPEPGLVGFRSDGIGVYVLGL